MKKLISFLYYFWEFIKALKRDVIAAKKLLHFKLKTRKFERDNSSIFLEFNKKVKKHPNKPCIIFNDETWTFQQVTLNSKFC